MKRSKSQFRRVMELDRLIRDGKYPNCLTFAEKWEVSQKTIQRDIDFLRDEEGAPLDYDREKKGFFYTNKTWALPSIVMNEGELLALMVASRVLEQYRGSPVATHLDSLFAKLSEFMTDKVRIQPELLHSQFTFRGPPAKPVDAKIWSTVVRGLQEQQTLVIGYRKFGEDRKEPAKEVRINPYHIANLQGEWYVFGVYAGMEEMRQFALSRIEQATISKERFLIPKDFSPEKMLAGTFGRFAGNNEVHTVRLLFTKEVAKFVTEREWCHDQKITVRKNGSVELEFPAKGLFEVHRWVLSWGRQVRVLAPKELQKSVAEEVKAMAAALE